MPRDLDVLPHHPDAPGSTRRTSELVAELLARDPAERMTVFDLVDGLRNRAMGFLVLVFSIPCTLPAPFPIPLLCSIVISAVAFNLVSGRVALWLPDRVGQRPLPTGTLMAMMRRALPWIARLERICRPRLLFLTEGMAKRIAGAVLLLLVVILLLPIPVIGNFTPGLAMGVIGIGLAERDGAVIGLGYLLTIAAIIVSLAVAAAAYGAVLWAVG